MSTLPVQQQDLEEETSTQDPAKVILFNDNVHTFEEVTGQLIKALRCEALTWEVHNSGKAVVYTGELSRCMEVSSILQEIELMTQIEV